MLDFIYRKFFWSQSLAIFPQIQLSSFRSPQIHIFYQKILLSLFLQIAVSKG